MHQQAKVVIKDCAERNKQQEPGYESVTESMKRRLKELVGDHYWKKANDYLIHFIEQKRRQHAVNTNRSGSGASSNARQQQQLQQQQLEQQRIKDRQKQQEEREHLRLKYVEQQRMQKEQHTGATGAKQRTANASSSIADLRQEIQDKREQITKAAPTSSKSLLKLKSASRMAAGTTTNTDTTTPTANKSKGTTKKPPRRKSGSDSSTVASRKVKTASTTGASNAITVPAKRIVVEEPPREYKELMELIDHAVDYDWPDIGKLLGLKTDLKLTEEEHLLLYGDFPESSKKNKKATGKAPQGQDMNQNVDVQDSKKVNNKVGVRPGWASSNVLSARAAWARVRLNELRIREKMSSNPSPLVADGLLTLPTSKVTSVNDQESYAAIDSAPATISKIEGSWISDETAEEDPVLALLSAACQVYLKGVLQKTIQCARQRQNLDGIRLWHQQYTFNKGNSTNTLNSTPLKETKSKIVEKSKRPPLSLRLGCDVSRQVAQAQGNAALVVKRMEEALARQPGIPKRARELNIDTLQEASSMGDLSWRPLLKEGPEKADYQAKRCFEVFGGKEAKDPPLGRVPKKAKLQIEDLIMGSELSIDGPYHKAFTASSFISF